MIVGIGVDLLNKKRFSQCICSSKVKSFTKRVYSEEELKEANKYEVDFKDRNYYLGTRFAGKEAVFKTLSISSNFRIELKDIRIINDSNGIPIVELNGKIAEIAKEKGITRILISLSYDTDNIIAFATAIAD